MPRKAMPRRKAVTRYLDQFSCQVPKGTPGARKVKTLTETYYFRGKSLETTDHAEAVLRVRDLLRKEELRKAGIIDDFTDHASRPLSEHLEEWHQSLVDSGISGKEADEALSRLQKMSQWAQWQSLGQITARTCLAALAHLQHKLGRSAQTANHYLRHTKQFVYWCVNDRRLRDNPLIGIKPTNVETDRRHDRRCPTDEEIGLLWSALEKPDARQRRGMSGPQRALGYRVCMATGLRANELRSLSRQSFDLEEGTVTVRAAYDKRRRKVVIPLPAWLTEELRAWFVADGECWSKFPAAWPGRLLKADLAVAGVPYAVEGPDGPLFFDFHSLRHHYVTWAANHPGISPKTLMELCRHSSADLTMRTYAKVRRADLHRVVESMPRPGRNAVAAPVAETNQTTGSSG